MHSPFQLKVSNIFEIEVLSLRNPTIYLKVGKHDWYWSFRS